MSIAKDTHDHEQVASALAALGADLGTIHVITIEGPPQSKSRPRLGKRGNVYAPDRPHLEALKLLLRANRTPKFPANVAVVCLFMRPNKQRIDADNMLKFVLDAATGVAWKDDCQVTALSGLVELDRKHPRTVIGFAEHRSSMDRTPGNNGDRYICQQCGATFYRYSSGREHRHCSRECSLKARGFGLEERICGQCGKSFQPETSYRKLCSPECRANSLRAKRRAKAAPPGRCEDCGRETSKPEYRRCRDCWKRARSLGLENASAPTKETCKRGHPFSEENTKFYRGQRVCKICARDASARYRKRKQQKAKQIGLPV